MKGPLETKYVFSKKDNDYKVAVTAAEAPVTTLTKEQKKMASVVIGTDSGLHVADVDGVCYKIMVALLLITTLYAMGAHCCSHCLLMLAVNMEYAEARQIAKIL